MNATLAPIAALCLAIPISMPASGADLQAMISECERCHGPGGVSGHSDIPSIGGQSEQYILDSLITYRAWGRPCVKSAYRYGDTARPEQSMCDVTENMTRDDFAALAEHFSALPWVPAQQDFNPVLAAQGAKLHEEHCESCHPKGGAEAGIGPRLAGQWTDYLRDALKYIPTGEHLVPPLMEKEIVSLETEDLDALMAHYASQGD